MKFTFFIHLYTVFFQNQRSFSFIYSSRFDRKIRHKSQNISGVPSLSSYNNVTWKLKEISKWYAILIIRNINCWIPVHTFYINICEEGLAFCVFRRHIQLSSSFRIHRWYIGCLRISFLYLVLAFTHFDMANVVCIFHIIVRIFFIVQFHARNGRFSWTFKLKF